MKKELRRAKQRRDWDTALKIATILKTEAETRKANHDIQMSNKNFFVAVLAVWVTFLSFVAKAFFNKN